MTCAPENKKEQNVTMIINVRGQGHRGNAIKSQLLHACHINFLKKRMTLFCVAGMLTGSPPILLIHHTLYTCSTQLSGRLGHGSWSHSLYT